MHKTSFSYVNLDDVTVYGHSFEGATALTIVHVDQRFRAAVLLDAWMQPVSKDLLQGVGNRVFPILHIVSEAFVDWKLNV